VQILKTDFTKACRTNHHWMIRPGHGPGESSPITTGYPDPANFARKTTAKPARGEQDSAVKDTKPKGFPT
jgi:hypothetical protein